MALTLKSAKAELAARGMEISFDRESGEYRVNFKGGREATASYTNDLADALGTGLAEQERAATFEAYEELARFDAGGPAARLDEELDRDRLIPRRVRR